MAELIGDRYRVTRILAQGFVAHVMAAVDTRDGRKVAIKIPRRRDDAGSALALLRREADILSRVANPHLPALYDSDLADEATAFLVTELCDGPAVTDGERLAPAALAKVIEAVARALDALHDAGFVHCDVKPENLLTAGGVVKLIDFNVALPVGGSSGGQFIGSPPYMAPELWCGDPVSPRTDVYALAATAVTLATGAPLFAESSQLGWMRAHLDERAPTLASRGVIVSVAAEEALARALAKNPADRPSRATEFARALS